MTEDNGADNGFAEPERFAVSIAVHEDAIVARVSGDPDH